jgi:predicted ferric reductase
VFVISDAVRATGKWAAGVSLLVVTILWIAGLADAPIGIAAAGRLAALWSADLLLIQVVLMARIPWFERSYGQDRLAKWHRWTGFASFHLLLAHVVLALIGSAERAGTNPLRQAWTLLVAYPSIVLAWVSLVAFVLVVVTSLRALRRKLRYESWHLLHLYAYLGVLFALPHEIWLGSDFRSPAARGYWWALYGIAVGSTLVFRIGLPIWRTLRHRLTVDAVVAEAPGLVSVYLTGRPGVGLSDRSSPRPAPGSSRAVLRLALPGRASRAARQPVLAVRPPRRRPAADHRQVGR